MHENSTETPRKNPYFPKMIAKLRLYWINLPAFTLSLSPMLFFTVHQTCRVALTVPLTDNDKLWGTVQTPKIFRQCADVLLERTDLEAANP